MIYFLVKSKTLSNKKILWEEFDTNIFQINIDTDVTFLRK